MSRAGGLIRILEVRWRVYGAAPCSSSTSLA